MQLENRNNFNNFRDVVLVKNIETVINSSYKRDNG